MAWSTSTSSYVNPWPTGSTAGSAICSIRAGHSPTGLRCSTRASNCAKLENLCEGQYDALTELRDSYLEETPEANLSDAYMVRLHDVMEHIQRVLHHARRLEASAESAVQLHFSANTHQTNEIVRTLTAIAAIFAPLTLITGVFGMNFEHMPLLKDLHGFGWTIAGMATVVVVMLLYFWARRILDRPRTPRPSRWLR